MLVISQFRLSALILSAYGYLVNHRKGDERRAKEQQEQEYFEAAGES